MSVGVVLAAAGSGKRMGAEGNKVLLPLDGKPILSHSLECFAAMNEVSEVVVVTRDVDLQTVRNLAEKVIGDTNVQVILGGRQRQDSVYFGLRALSPDTNWVIIHDGARPFVSRDLVRTGLKAVKQHLAVGVAVPVKDTIKKVQDGVIVETPPRAELWAMQTPQIFKYDLVLKVHKEAKERGFTATDDCALLEKWGQSVHIVKGDYSNIKITTPEDLPRDDRFFVGFGYDVHRLVKDRPLILGGVEIPYKKGLLGHSDADVVTHSVMDAVLGAMGRGDIGELFPDTDPKYKGISSITLLEQVLNILNQEQLSISNLDITIMAEQPKLRPWKEPIKVKLAQVLGIGLNQINIKATTTEGLGFVGREEGISTQVVVSLRSRQKLT